MNRDPHKGIITPSDAIMALSASFMDLHAVRAWAISLLHPEGAFCPSCHDPIIDENRVTRFLRFDRLSCPSCKKKFSAATGTMLEGSKLNEREIFLCALLFSLGQKNQAIASILDCSDETVRRWRQKFAVIETSIAQNHRLLERIKEAS